MLAQQIIPAAPAGGWLNEEVNSPGPVCSLTAPSSILPRQAAHIVQPLFSCQPETFYTHIHTVQLKHSQPFVCMQSDKCQRKQKRKATRSVRPTTAAPVQPSQGTIKYLPVKILSFYLAHTCLGSSELDSAATDSC